MSHQEILTKAIEKAIDGGWHFWKPGKDGWTKEKELDYHLEALQNAADGAGGYNPAYSVIFDKDFAKALWPWDDSIKCPYCGICLTGSLMHPRPCPFGVAEVFAQPMWQYHLQMMVISDDPIEYLGEHL